METEIESAVKNLEQKFQSINQFAETDWDFFLHIANYVKFIKEVPVFQAVIAQMKEVKLDQFNLENYKNQALQELQKKRDQLIEKVKTEKVSFKGSQALLVKLQKCKSTDLDKLFLSFSAFLHALEMGDYYNLAETFRDVETETPQVRFYTPSKAYELYRSEKERLEGIEKTESELGFNNAWQNLELIYFLVFEKDNYFQKIILKPNVNANVKEFSILVDEIERMKNGSPSYHFQRNKFEQYLKIAHSQLMNKLDKNGISAPIFDDKKFDDKKSLSPLKITVGYNEKTREIKINGLLIAKPRFDSSNHTLFEYLFNNAGKVFTKNDLEECLKIKVKSYNSLLNDLKIKKTIRKYIVNCTKNKIQFLKEVVINDSEDIENINRELKMLVKVAKG